MIGSPLHRGLGAALLLSVAVAAAAAHDKFKIVGVVVAIHETQLDVKAIDGHLYEIDFAAATPVTRDHRKVARSALGAGSRVLVHAIGHDVFDLEAVEVQIDPPPTPWDPRAGMSGREHHRRDQARDRRRR
jgi:hypothetical protein